MSGPRPFMDQLDAASVTWLREHSTTRSVQAGEGLCHEGDAATASFVVERGLLRIERYTLDGDRTVLTLAGRGDVVGNLAVLDGAPRSASVVGVQHTDVLVTPARHMTHALNTFPDVALATARILADRLRSLTDQFIEATSGTAQSRTAARLTQLIDTDIESGEFTIAVNVSQAELAAWAGLSRAGVVKTLRRFREVGLIETARQRIVVRDVARLRSVAQGGDDI